MFHKNNLTLLPNNGTKLKRQNATLGNDFIRTINTIQSNFCDLNSVSSPLFNDSDYSIKQKENIAYIGFYRRVFLRQNKQDAQGLGWKLHINVDFASLEKTWSLIAPILKTYQINVFKILKPNTAINKLNKSPNMSLQECLERYSTKEVTIYQNYNKNNSTEYWQSLVLEIESALTENNIKAGRVPFANRSIRGSNYFSYRNDQSPHNKHKYFSDLQAREYAYTYLDKPAYNPSNAPNDPFKDIEITPHPIKPLHRR